MKYVKALFYTIIVITLIVQQVQIYYLMDRMEYCPMWTRSLGERLDRHAYNCNQNNNILWDTLSSYDEKLRDVIETNNLVEKYEQ